MHLSGACSHLPGGWPYPYLSPSSYLSTTEARHGPPLRTSQRNLIARIGRTGAPTPCQSRPAVKTAQAASPATSDPPVEARRPLHCHHHQLQPRPTSGLGHVIPVAYERRAASRNQDSNDVCSAHFTISPVPLYGDQPLGSVVRGESAIGKLRGSLRTTAVREMRRAKRYLTMLSSLLSPSAVSKKPPHPINHQTMSYHLRQTLGR